MAVHVLQCVYPVRQLEKDSSAWLLVLVLQDKGLVLRLKRAGLQWSADGPTSTLWAALLLHDVGLFPGTTCCACLHVMSYAYKHTCSFLVQDSSKLFGSCQD